MTGPWRRDDAPAGESFPILSILASEAREVKNKIAVVKVGKLDNVPVLDTTDTKTPELQSPYSRYIDIRMLKIQSLYSLIIRTDTGEVLARGSFDKAGVYKSVPIRVAAANSRATHFETRVFDDPGKFCKATVNVDSTGERGLADKRYIGPQSPKFISEVMKDAYYWRCMNGKIYACHTGATGRGCGKPILGDIPTPIVRDYCASNPDDTYIPGAANDMIMPWKCNGTTPSPIQTGPPPVLDVQGYFRENWL